MPYLVLLAGILLGLFAFFKFFTKSTTQQIRRFFLTIFLCAYTLILFELAMTGRIAIAIILLLCLVPFIISYYRRKAKETKALPPPDKKN